MDNSDWYRNRGYLHFDHRVGLKKALKVVTSPQAVAKHAFYPFIRFEINSKKLVKDTNTKRLEIKTKTRPIAYASHMDGHIYSFYSQKLSSLYEEKLELLGLSENVLAFRNLGKSNIDFALDAFTKIKSTGECAAIALDFSKFFDTLDHSILKNQWANLLQVERLPLDHFNIFKSLTKFSVVERSALYQQFDISNNNPRSKIGRISTAEEFRGRVRKKGLIEKNVKMYGIPQGSSMSALLSNIYMLTFDLEMKRYAQIHGGTYYRYCDDMLFIVPIKLKNDVAGFAQKNIKELKVKINPSKTELRTFSMQSGVLTADKPLQYLGFIFDGENIYLRSSSLARYSEKMKRGISLAKQTMRKYNQIRNNKGLADKEVFMKKLYSRYTHLGGRNFVRYGHRAAEKMQSKTIRRQLKPLWKRFHEELNNS